MIDKSQFPRFFSALRDACVALGIKTEIEKEEYYRATCLHVARVMSVKDIKTQADFDAVLAAFAADAGSYRAALDASLEVQKRRAFVVRVLVAQIMQLNCLDTTNARRYLDGVLAQSKLGASWVSRGSSFYLDIPAPNLHKVLQILDTHLRRLKRQLQVGGKKSVDWRVKYAVQPDGFVRVEPVDKYFYSNINFNVSTTTF